MADAVDAMMRDRPYAPARSAAAALDELRRCAGTQFDPVVVDAYVACFDRERQPSPAPVR